LDKAVVTCALTGVLTDPAVYPAPVTPEAMAREARRACDEGASVVHVHFRRLEPGEGHLPSWEPEVATAVVSAIRDASPNVIINQTTGVVGPDIAGPLACLKAVRPEIAALNAGSLNYLKTRADGAWAWPPMLFDNPVEKVAAFLAAMGEWGIEPEFECFDTGIVRAAAAIARNCGYRRAPKYNFVMGVESGMPADPELLLILTRLTVSRARWSVTAIGRKEIWPLHRRAAELGGDLRTGLEDTIHLPDGARAASNGELVKALVAVAREAGREIATPDEARRALGLLSHEEVRP
jgi:3-keto-5-aminohexanoate cleavage enzyme